MVFGGRPLCPTPTKCLGLDPVVGDAMSSTFRSRSSAATFLVGAVVVLNCSVDGAGLGGGGYGWRNPCLQCRRNFGNRRPADKGHRRRHRRKQVRDRGNLGDGRRSWRSRDWNRWPARWFRRRRTAGRGGKWWWRVCGARDRRHHGNGRRGSGRRRRRGERAARQGAARGWVAPVTAAPSCRQRRCGRFLRRQQLPGRCCTTEGRCITMAATRVAECVEPLARHVPDCFTCSAGACALVPTSRWDIICVSATIAPTRPNGRPVGHLGMGQPDPVCRSTLNGVTQADSDVILNTFSPPGTPTSLPPGCPRRWADGPGPAVEERRGSPPPL